MKLAICNEMFVDRPWDDICASIAAHGFTGVEIAPFMFKDLVTDVTASEREDIKRVAHENGLDVVGLHWLLAKTTGFHLTSRDASVRKATSDYLLELVQFCSDVGGNVLVFGSPQQRNLEPGMDLGEGLDLAADVFAEPTRLAGDLGVTFAFEPLTTAETNFINTAAEGRQLVERVDHPAFRLHLDAKAMAPETIRMDQLVKTHADILAHVHVNDVNLLGPGMGHLDLRPLLTALKEINYDGYISVEIFDMSFGPERVMTESYDYLTSILKNGDDM